MDRGYTAQGVWNPNHTNDWNPSSTEKESGVKPPNRQRKCGNLPVGVLLGIRGGGVPPGCPNPDPISDQKM